MAAEAGGGRDADDARQGAARLPSPGGHPALRQLDPATRFLYAPHTITSLLTGAPPGASALPPAAGARWAQHQRCTRWVPLDLHQPPSAPSPIPPAHAAQAWRRWCTTATSSAPSRPHSRARPPGMPRRACGPPQSSSWVGGGCGSRGADGQRSLLVGCWPSCCSPGAVASPPGAAAAPCSASAAGPLVPVQNVDSWVSMPAKIELRQFTPAPSP
jgi:hypothetical protein